MMIKDDDLTGLTVFLHHREEGKSEEEAAAAVRKFHPIYGVPDDTTHTTGDDRPLPFELKDRVNIYVQNSAMGDRDAFKRELEASSTFNSVVRKEISAGKI